MKQYNNTNYSITESGLVYNNKTNRFLKLTIRKERRSKYARAYVGLSINKKQKWFTVSRLVAELYIPNPNNYSQVNHIDGNPLNNCKDNLEWVNQSQNIRHAISNGLKKIQGENNPAAKLTKELVNKAIEDYHTTKYSLRQLANKYNVSYTAIRYAVNGKTWK